MGGSTDAEKAALIAEIASTRRELTNATEALRDAADVPSRIKQNIQRNRAKWIAAAVVTGVLLTKLRGKKKVVYVDKTTGDILGSAAKAGILWTGLKLLGGLAKPLLGEYAKSRLAEMAARYAERRRTSPNQHQNDR